MRFINALINCNFSEPPSSRAECIHLKLCSILEVVVCHIMCVVYCSDLRARVCYVRGMVCSMAEVMLLQGGLLLALCLVYAEYIEATGSYVPLTRRGTAVLALLSLGTCVGSRANEGSASPGGGGALVGWRWWGADGGVQMVGWRLRDGSVG